MRRSGVVSAIKPVNKIIMNVDDGEDDPLLLVRLVRGYLLNKVGRGCERLQVRGMVLNLRRFEECLVGDTLKRGKGFGVKDFTDFLFFLSLILITLFFTDSKMDGILFHREELL